MRQPAPYTPATLRRIRDGASAADLGWPSDRYQRICREHGIARQLDAVPSPEKQTPFSVLKFDDVRGIITYSGAQLVLREPIEVAIFGALVSEARKGKGDALASTVFRSAHGRKWSRAHVNRAVAAINHIIAVAGFWIEGIPGDGYRLTRAKP